MSAAKYWSTAIITDALLVALFYVWQVNGIEQAGNVAVFWVWFMVVIKILAGASADKTTFADKPRPAGFVWYHAVTEVALISALVWVGYVWLPAFYLLGSLMMEGARNRKPKAVAA